MKKNCEILIFLENLWIALFCNNSNDIFAFSNDNNSATNKRAKRESILENFVKLNLILLNDKNINYLEASR